MRTTQVIQEMTILDLLPGASPAILLGKETNVSSSTRVLTQKVAIPDAALYQELCTATHIGDKIKATLVTHWQKDKYITYLTAFYPVATPVNAE